MTLQISEQELSFWRKKSCKSNVLLWLRPYENKLNGFHFVFFGLFSQLVIHRESKKVTLKDNMFLED